MKTLFRLPLFGIVLLFSLACEPNDDNAVPKDLKINDFVWKGMNLYYLWQEDVNNLFDDRFSNQDELNDFLAGYNNPINLFQDLRVAPSIDRFSVIFSDYRALEGVLSGTTDNNGVDFGLRYLNGSTTDIFGWVRYILPNSDASEKNVHRGDIFYAINGTPLTINNYQSLLANQTYTLNFADYNNGSIVPNGESVTLTKTPYSENPVYITNVVSTGSHTIGYLMYNGFYPNFETQLNVAIAQLQAQNITDLVLDLRYNSGGSIGTATRLASMITGQFIGQLFAKEQWNDKAQDYLEENNPTDLLNFFTAQISNGTAINNLNLSRIYVLTSKSTASASELVINGLAPYIDVVQIGDATIGKNVGSITLYDSVDFKKEGSNPSHNYAMQPIVLKIVNSEGFGDYPAGLPADYLLLEDLGNLAVLGSDTEPLFNEAINQITASGRKIQSPLRTFQHFKDSKSLRNLQNQMYKDQVPSGISDMLKNK